jgi:hypothetical protein
MYRLIILPIFVRKLRYTTNMKLDIEENISNRWKVLTAELEKRFDLDINIESILFLIGIRELGSNGKQEFTKEQKVDLMHIAMCKLLSSLGYYKLTHIDQDGWPHWELMTPLPQSDNATQTRLLRVLILDYFAEIWEFV